MNSVRNKSIHELGQYFEQSIISHMPDEEVPKCVQKAIEYNMAGVYCWDHELDIVKPMLEGNNLFLGSGIAFPLGQDGPDIKAFTAEYLFKRGVTNLDFVMNHGALREGKFSWIEHEVSLIRKAVPEAVLKMIIECCYLSDEQIDFACKVAIENKIDFVKSSTGQFQGPRFDQITRIVDHMHGAGLSAKVAGIKFPHPQNAMVTLLAGVDRIGSQQCVAILDGISELRVRGVF